MKKTINLFFDMDGVQTVYDKENCVEDMMKPGYFSSRVPHRQVIEFIKLLLGDERFRITVLSAVFTDSHSAFEKINWLEKQGLSQVDMMFVPCGVPKCDFINDDGMNVLIDDFSKNLFEWEAAGDNYYGIKFLNEINGINGTWKEHNGFTLDYRMSAGQLYFQLLEIIEQFENTWSVA